jgi:hypothetical protein
MAERGDIRRPIAIILGIYVVLLAGGVRWHWASGPPYFQGTPGLLITFALVAALIGLVSIWTSFAVVHWSTRASGMIMGAALLAGLATFFFQWNEFLIWQLMVLILVQLALMIAVLGVFRLLRLAVVQTGDHPPFGRELRAEGQAAATVSRARPSQFRVSNLLLITAALALLLSVLHYVRPVSLNLAYYTILIIGGICAAAVSLAPLLACFSNLHIGLRIIVLVCAAPLGGIVYAVLDYYEPLLFSWPFYAAVTALQVLFMTLPLAVARWKGYGFGRVPNGS